MSANIADGIRQRRGVAVEHATGVIDENVKLDGNDDNPEIDPSFHEYSEYFMEHYGDNPRTDFLGIDGCALFCLIYIVVAGVVLTILYVCVYSRNQNALNFFEDRIS